jgi:hypothetical protein
MQEHIARVDTALIDRLCQPLVDWVCQHAAFDCFKMARVCTDLSALAWILSQTPGAAAAFGTAPFGYEVFQFALIVLVLGAITVLRTLFERAGGTRQGGQANPLRAVMYTHRFGCLLGLTAVFVKTAMTPIGFVELALLAVSGFATLAVYVGACSNRPPKRSEHRADNWSWRPAEARGGR